MVNKVKNYTIVNLHFPYLTHTKNYIYKVFTGVS